MKISFSSNLYVNKINVSTFKNNSIGFKGDIRIEDIFVKSDNYFEPINDRVKNPFDTQKRKFDISDYKKLSKAQIESVKNAKDNYWTEQKAKRDVSLAIALKKDMDREFGEGKYVFECIGTSPSTLARVFEFMGVETHYLPISNFRLFTEPTIFSMIKNQEKGRKAYGKFLKSQGISRGEIEKSDKAYVFYDYYSTGKTSKMYKKILEKFFDIPVDRDNVHFRALNGFLYRITLPQYNEYGDSSEEQQRLKLRYDCYLDEELNKNGAAQHGGIAHLGFNDLIHIDDIKKDSTGLNSKIYNFFVMDILNEQGLLKENPKNKKSL